MKRITLMQVLVVVATLVTLAVNALATTGSKSGFRQVWRGLRQGPGILPVMAEKGGA